LPWPKEKGSPSRDRNGRRLISLEDLPIKVLMDNDHTTALLEGLEPGYSLPSFSPITMKLVDMASNEMSSVDELTHLIESDPSLAVRLLSLANSALFRPDRPVATLGQAIMRIGTDRLRIMALSLSLRDTFPMGRVGAMDYERFWRSSLYQALIAKALASQIQNCDPEEAFVSALILEIGLLVFFDVFKNDLPEDSPIELYPIERLLSWERGQCGSNHREIGEAVLKHWRFPDSIVACQRYHGQGQWEGPVPVLAQTCDVAREFAAIVCEEAPELDSAFAIGKTVFGLRDEVVNEVLATAFDEVDGIASTIKVVIDRDRDIFELVEKANKALVRLSERLSAGESSQPGSRLPSFESLDKAGQTKVVVIDTLQAVAHEIRNPLVAVGGFAKRLASATDPGSKEGRYARIIVEEAERLEQRLREMMQEPG
jgi:HD-like signal output (HDOD) protein